MRKSVQVIIFLLICHPVTVLGNDFYSQDISYMYDPNAEISFSHRLAHFEDTFSLYFQVELNTDVYEMIDYSVYYEFKKSYNERLSNIKDTLHLLDHIIKRKGPSFYFEINFPYSQSGDLLVLTVVNDHNKKRFYYDISVSKDSRFGNRHIMPFDQSGLPYLKSYIYNNQNYQVLSLMNPEDFTYWYQYLKNFNIADPPMATKTSGIQPELRIDTSFLHASTKYIKIEKESLVFIQDDSSGIRGLGLRVADKYFPKLAKIEDVIHCLRYFSTRDEWNRLSSAENKKEALDRYWLDITKSTGRAKRIIKQYFDHVEYSNRFFTTYKEGWKTDKGMIFIIFGKPDEVHRSGEGEIWIYNKNEYFPKLKFSFAKVPNIFTNDHYVLIRDKNFQNEWFRAIDLWRNGRFEKIFE